MAITGWLVFAQKARPPFLLGLAMAMAGAAVLMRTSAASGETRLLGDLLGVITGVFYAAYLMTVERLRARYSTTTIMAHAVPVSAAVMLVASLAFGEAMAATTLAGWAVLLGVAVIPQVLGQNLIAFGLARLPVAFASVSLLVQPVIAACLAWVLLSEAIGPVQGLGAAAVLAGIAIAHRAGRTG